MKKFLALTALVLGLASCQTEPEGLDINVGGAVDTVVTVNIPENETRANNSGIGVFENGVLDGDATMRYIFQVYYRAEDGTVTKSTERQVKYTDGTSVTFPVRLIPGRDYQFVVWADVVTAENAGDNHYNTTNLEAVSVIENSWKAMDETRDAFTASYAANDYNGSQSINIDLYRPFAKLRVIATDYDELAKIGIEVKKAAVNYTTVHRSTFNAYDSKAIETDVASIEKDHSTYVIATYANETGDEHTIFSDYFFAENDVVKFEITVYDQNNDEIVTRALTTDIYAKRNYLTTIKGDILTDGNNVNVVVKPGFGKPDVEVDGDIKDELSEAAKNKHYVIDLEGDFIWETGSAHGSNPLIPADAITETLTINGNGYKFIATGTGVGAIRLANGGKLILNDLTVVDQSEYHSENGETAWEFTYLEFAGETEFNDCVIDNTVALDGAKAVFNNCTFNDKETWPANVGQEYAAWVSNGTAHFNGCQFSGSRGIKVHEDYGTEVKEVVVDNCQFNNLSKKPGMALGTLNADTKIEIKNSTFTNCQPGDQGLYMYETDTVVTTFTFVNENNTVNTTIATSEAFAKVLKADIHTLNIALAADVTVDVSANSADKFFGGNNTNTITINGAKVTTAAATGAGNNTYTLTFNHTNGDWNYVRFNNDNAKWVIKNVKLTNSGNNNGPWNRHDIRFYNDVVLENVTSDKAIALLADADLTNVVISDVHPDDGEAYALWITAEGQTVNIKDCALLAHESKQTDRGIKIEHQYIDAPAKVTLNIDGLKVKSQKKAAIMVNSKAGADITLKNVDLSEVTEDTKNAVWVDSDATDYAYLVNVTGGSMYTEGAPIINGNEALKDVDIKDNSVVYLGEGEYIIPATAKGKTVKFVGTGNPEDTKVAVTKVGTGYENCDYGLDGSTVTFENITITTNSSTYIGYARCNGTYKNCIINGTYTLYGDSVFEDCTLNVSGDVYNIWTWGAPTATFTNCTFNCDGKAMLLYGTANTKLTMNNCVFNDNGSISGKAAIETGNDYNKSYELTVNNATVNGFAINPNGFVTGTTLWANKNSMPASKLKVTVDGKNAYNYVAAADNTTSFTNAITNGATEVVLSNGNYTMPEPELRGKTLTITGTRDVVIDATAVDARDQFVTGATMVFDGVTINFGNVNYMGFANTASLTYKNCKINGLQFLFGENVTFENCELDSNGAEHTVWTYGCKNVTFTECDFTYGDRGVNCYSDNDVDGGQTVNFTKCTFATENTASEGAVEINSYFIKDGIVVNLDGCTAPAYGELAYVSPWDSANGAKTTINIK